MFICMALMVGVESRLVGAELSLAPIGGGRSLDRFMYVSVTGRTGRRLMGHFTQHPVYVCVDPLSSRLERCPLQLLERRQHGCAVKLYPWDSILECYRTASGFACPIYPLLHFGTYISPKKHLPIEGCRGLNMLDS